MKNVTFTKTLVTMIFITGSVIAHDLIPTGGIYLGAGIGNTFYSSEATDALDQIQEISENSTAWKIWWVQSSQIYWF